MPAPDPELIDDENPEWTEQDFATAIPFSALPGELQKLLTEEKHVRPETKSSAKRQPAA